LIYFLLKSSVLYVVKHNSKDSKFT